MTTPYDGLSREALIAQCEDFRKRIDAGKESARRNVETIKKLRAETEQITGWYWADAEYPEEGWTGPYESRELADEAAIACGGVDTLDHDNPEHEDSFEIALIQLGNVVPIERDRDRLRESLQQIVSTCDELGIYGTDEYGGPHASEVIAREFRKLQQQLSQAEDGFAEERAELERLRRVGVVEIRDAQELYDLLIHAANPKWVVLARALVAATEESG